MKIKRLEIRNYRSVKELQLDLQNMLVLVGPNNHGKSNILRALEFGLSTSVKPSPDDFFALRGPTEDLWVEMTFHQLTDQEVKTFQKYVHSDGTVRIRKTALMNPDGTMEIRYNGYVEEPDEWWLKSSAWDRLSSREKVELEARDVPQLQSLLQEPGKITREKLQSFQRDYIKEHSEDLRLQSVLESGPLLGQKNVGGGVLPEFLLVPAVRDLSDEVKIKATTVFGKLLQRAVGEMAARDQRFIELRDRLHGLIAELNARPGGAAEVQSGLAQLESLLESELQTWGVKVSVEVSPPEMEKLFELGTRVYLDDGVRTLAEHKGHGLQRALIFALLRAWTKVIQNGEEPGPARPRRSSCSIIFAIEEPELFLHPHGQRQLLRTLEQIATLPGHQVLLSTHSTYFIKLEEYRRIAIVTKASPQEGTRARQCSKDLFEDTRAGGRKRRFQVAAWINPERGELFFAEKVILVEGETEKAVFPFLAEKLGCFDPKVTVIDCGGKKNLPMYMEILNAFGIPYCVVHDVDSVDDATNESIGRCLNAQLGHVERFDPCFEAVAGLDVEGGRRSKPLAALEWFEALPSEAIPQLLADIVRGAYRLEKVKGMG